MGCLLHLLAIVLQVELLHSLAFGYSDSRLMLGKDAGPGGVRDYEEEPLLLNCFSRHLDLQGNVASQVAVNIIPTSGYGPTAGVLGYGQSKSSGLSGRIQISSKLKEAGKAYIFITERADLNNVCSNQGFGKILTSDKNNLGKHVRFGTAGYGFSAGYEKMYHGWGNPTYGYGNYLPRYNSGFGNVYGGTNGYATGFGIGGPRMGFGGGFGLAGDGFFLGEKDSDKGAVAILDVAPGVLTSGVVDNVGFDNLEDLAGRGVMVCSGVTYDREWNPVCREPIYSCCSLKYDNVELSLVGS